MKNKELFEEAVYLHNTGQYENAAYLFEGLVEKRHAEALNYLGGYYLEGIGVLPDTRKAFEYLITAAVLGLSSAQYNLANFYEKYHKEVDNLLSPLLADYTPCKNILDDDNEGAFYWYFKSANQGYEPALHRLGNHYAASVQKNIDAAVDYYRQAAAGAYAPSQYALGFCYDHGEMFNMITNYDMAFKWYLKAAEQKHPQAMIDISRFYSEGISVPVDKDKSDFWRNEAAIYTNPKTPCKLIDMDDKTRDIQDIKYNKSSVILYVCNKCKPYIQCGLGCLDNIIYIDTFGSHKCELRYNLQCFGNKETNKPEKELRDVRIEAEMNPLWEWEYINID